MNPNTPVRKTRSESPGDGVGPYNLLKLLDDEGIAAMWLAERHDAPKERVTLFMVHGGIDPQAIVARFEAQRRAMEAAEIAGMCRALGAGITTSGRVYLVMEHAGEDTLLDYADRETLTVEDRIDHLRGVCASLDQAHKLGIVHGDLRPHCIRIVEGPGIPYAKIVGAGVIQAVGRMPDFRSRFLESGYLGSSIQYRSPEGWKGDTPLDPRTDIYALGLLLYELIYGLLPVDPATLRSVGYAAISDFLQQQPVPLPFDRLMSEGSDFLSTLAEFRQYEPDDLRDRLRESFEWICLKALRAAPRERYATPGELAEDLWREHLGQPTHAGPGSSPNLIASNHPSTQTLTVVQREMYTAKIAAAGALIETGDLKRARTMLESCPEDLRAWEWRWLLAQTDSSLLMLSGHQGRVHHVAFDPSGNRVVTASEDSSARVWDASTGRSLAVLRGHRYGVVWAGFDPSGTRILTGSDDRTARVWNAATGKELTVLEGHEAQVVFAAFSPNGEVIFTSSRDRTTRLWDAASGKTIAEMREHKNVVFAAAFSSDGARLVTAAHDKTAMVWDGATGARLAEMTGHSRALEWVAWNPTDERVVTASNDHSARVWDAATGSQIAELKGHEGPLHRAVFSPDGTKIATASGDSTAGIWDAFTGNLISRLRAHQSSVTTVAFSRSGERVVTASLDQTVRIWDSATGQQVVVLRGHQSPIHAAAVSPSGGRIVSTAGKDAPLVWDGAHDLRSSILSPASKVLSARFSPSGHRILTTSGDRIARIWDADTGTLMASLRGHTGKIVSATFDGTGGQVLTASDDWTARVWDARTGAVLAVLTGHKDRLVSGAISPAGDWVVTGSHDGTARVFDVKTATETSVIHRRNSGSGSGDVRTVISPSGTRLMTLSKTSAWIWDVATLKKVSVLEDFEDFEAAVFSAAGDRLLGATERAVRIWDLASGEAVCALNGHSDMVVRAEFSRAGDRVVTASLDGTARVWDAVSGKEIARLKGHAGRVRAAAFNPSGDRVVTSSEDHTARVWDALTGVELATLKGHSGTVWSACFDPQGDRIVTASDDMTARIWHALAYRDMFPAISRFRDATTKVASLVRGRRSAGDTLEAVSASLINDPSLTDAERDVVPAEVDRVLAEEREAGKLARLEADDLNDAAWKLISIAPVSVDAASRAVTLSQRAVAVDPKSGHYLNTLGIALYRKAAQESELREALDVLIRSAEENAKRKTGPVPADFAFIAMIQWRLGRKAEALSSAAKFEELAASDRWRARPDTVAWAAELASTMSSVK